MEIDINKISAIGWTTHQESHDLVKAGLPSYTSDMCYLKDDAGLFLDIPFARNPSKVEHDSLPCWSLGMLKTILPCYIKCENGYASFAMRHNNTIVYSTYYGLSFADGYDYTLYASPKGGRLIGNVVRCILWLLENGYMDNVLNCVTKL